MDRFNFKSEKEGSITLELLITFVILIMNITAVMLIIYGGQSIIVDSQTSNEALSMAQNLMEKAKSDANLDFNLVNPIPSTSYDIYNKSLLVNQVNLFTKKITSIVDWKMDDNRDQEIKLVSYLTNPDAVDGGDTCSSILTGNWKSPHVIQSYDLKELVDPSSGFPVTDIQVHDNKLYVTISNNNGNNGDKSFIIFDVSEPSQYPQLPLGMVDNNPAKKYGLNAVAVSNNYAYVANAYTPTNFASCTSINGVNPSCAQFQVIDINNPSNPLVKYSLKLPNVSGGQAKGKSIFYKDGYVYLGLTSTGPGNGPEFHVIDVHNPLAPVAVGSWPDAEHDINNVINDIYVRGNYAYLAHPRDSVFNEQMTILDISNPSNPQRVGGFYYSDSIGGNGKSLAMVGNTLFLGRTASNINNSADNIPEFFALNNSNPTSIQSVPLGTKALDTAISINGLIVRDYLAFFITNTEFQIWNIGDLNNIYKWETPSLSLPGSTVITMDCEGNYIFVGSLDTNNQGFVSLITGS
jgi:hypothetical protein